MFVQPVAPAPIVLTTTTTAFGGPCCNYNGCGGCGQVSYGCGNCGQVSYGCGNCGAVSYGCGNCGGYAVPSLYMVNQGPVYSGPGLTVPYETYSPEMAYAPATDYPYVSAYAAPALWAGDATLIPSCNINPCADRWAPKSKIREPA